MNTIVKIQGIVSFQSSIIVNLVNIYNISVIEFFFNNSGKCPPAGTKPCSTKCVEDEQPVCSYSDTLDQNKQFNSSCVFENYKCEHTNDGE